MAHNLICRETAQSTGFVLANEGFSYVRTFHLPPLSAPIESWRRTDCSNHMHAAAGNRSGQHEAEDQTEFSTRDASTRIYLELKWHWKWESSHLICLWQLRTTPLQDRMEIPWISVSFLLSYSPLGTSATSWPMHQPLTTDDECGAIGGMRIGRENRSTRRKPTPVPLCPPQIPHDLTWTRTRAAAVVDWL
jgi:hypothetical protein